MNETPVHVEPSAEGSARSSDRRAFMGGIIRGAALFGMGGLVGLLTSRTASGETRWQIDPAKCNGCGKCSTECVLDVSAVKCVQAYAMCGYCDLCTGYFGPNPPALDTGAENQLCPTGAIQRTFVEDPYFEYHIDEDQCVGCAKCVVGCTAFGNGSLYLQIQHDRCVDCNECRIARECPTQAIRRVPSDEPYLLKDVEAT